MATYRKCVILGPAYPLRGGIAQLNESLSSELTKQGVENVIFSFYLQYPDFLFPGKTQKEVGGSAPYNVEVRETISSINPISWKNTATQIADLSPDFVIVRFWLPFMGPCLGTICKWVKQKTNAPIIGILDNVVPHEQRLGDKAFTNYFLNQCDAFITMSSTVQAELSQFDSLKPRKLLYHPVYNHFGEIVTKSVARKKLNLKEDDQVILFFGMIRKYKGLELLLNALSCVEDKTKLKLVVAGEFYEDQSKYDQLIEQLGLNDQVVVHAGFVDKTDVKYYFCAADLVAQPYLSATQSGVTQIAYHFETPMLVTDVGGLPEMVPHEKVGYVCNREPQSITNSIEAFYNGSKEQEFKQNIRIEKKRFEWNYFVKQVVELTASRV